MENEVECGKKQSANYCRRNVESFKNGDISSQNHSKKIDNARDGERLNEVEFEFENLSCRHSITVTID